jgi:hypothetical protein
MLVGVGDLKMVVVVPSSCAGVEEYSLGLTEGIKAPLGV